MMAEDWDLFAIVRSCQSATNTAITTTESPLTTTTNTIPSSISTSTVNEFEELNQLFTSFNTTTTTTSGHGINLISLDFAGCIAQQEGQQTTTPTSIWPHFVPEASTSSFNRFHEQQLQQQNQLQVVQKQEFQVPQNNSAIALPNTQPQTPRSRKRKSQQGKMVCHVTADNLSADLWAWRKYGQKPIKGSPYPRNYYRCSSSKGCNARKLVERSNTMDHMFTVTYTGDHNHPRPTHRNSLAGSSRTKSPAMHPPTSLSFQPNTTASSSSAPNSPVTSSSDLPENDFAHDGSGPDPDPKIEPDEESEDEGFGVWLNVPRRTIP